MKLRYFLTGLVLALACVPARAQVFDMYYQGFETTEAVNFTLSPTSGAVYDNTVSASGDRSLKLVQSLTDDIVLISDTLDFTQNSTLRYIALEFDHICNAYVSSETGEGCKIYWKRANQSDNQWTRVSGTAQNNSVDNSTEFASVAHFNRHSYTEEWNTNTVDNNMWKSARMDLNDILTAGVAPSERLVLIKFVVDHKGSGATNGVGWWLDNIRVRSSQNQMVTPTVEMRIYPDGGLLPSSRGARVSLMASTTVPQGIWTDSAYIVYTIGSDPTEHRLYMTPSMVNSTCYGNEQRFSARIPFCGYDTLMRFYCVVRDNTTNHNVATYPATANSWVEYRCVRGVSQPGLMTAAFSNTTAAEGNFPFPQHADARSEWVYDSALMAQAGYGPGAITAIRYRVTANNLLQYHPRFQVRMKNLPADYYREIDEFGSNYPFTGSTDFKTYAQAVYDSAYTVEEVGAGTEVTIQLQDTFFYAGKDLMVQIIYDGNTDFSAKTFLAMIPGVVGKPTLYYYGGASSYNYNPFSYEGGMQRSSDGTTKRPLMIMTMQKNQLLVHDLGVSSIAFPNENNPMINQPSHLDVTLKNFGVAEVNGVRISYSIDDTIFGSYDWAGSLAGGDSTVVTVATGVTLPAGYHFACSWVEDTLTVGTQHIRDHEPLNNSSCAEFIVCDGPVNGVQYVGGDSADYNSISEALFSLSQCGVNDSVIIKLAPGNYPPFAVTAINGISEQNYVVIEPVDSLGATIIADGSSDTLADLSVIPWFRLRNLSFLRNSGTLTNMVALGSGSTGCRIENCTFTDGMDNPPSALRIEALLNSGFANHLTVTGCTFTGGGVGINLSGQASDMRSHHNVVSRNLFYNQYSSAMTVGNQSRVTVEHNEMYDVLSNSSYVLRLLQCSDTVRVLANKIYTSHGGQAIGVSGMAGTSAVPALIANNMVVCEDDGTANQQNTPFNIIDGQWIDVLFNSVKLVAPDRANVAAATLGGATISNCRFLNNIVTCFDNSNYAFNFMPGTQTTNIVGHNVYYSEGYTLNKRSGSGYHTLAAWQQAVEMDSTSVSLNPVFLNGSLVDLRTFNRLVKGVGTPIGSVTVDMFDTVRNSVAPCPGAFEFVSLYYDFEVEALLNPLADNCDMPDNVELVVAVRNSGVSDYTPGGAVSLNLGFSVNGGTPQSFAVSRPVLGEDTAVIFTGHTMQLPPNGIHDATHRIKVWVASPSDPNQTNDTTTFNVVSRYHFEAPTDVTHSIPYNTADTITVTDGITQWPVYNSSAAPTVPSNIYWYLSPDDTEPYLPGNTLTTGVLQQDTHFYVRQKREIPIVRITQVQLFRDDTVVGLTSPLPEWIHPATSVVVQLTNVGDKTAYLENDSILFVSPTAAANNKFIKFASNVTIAPGASLVIQFYSGSVTLTDQLPYMVQKKQLPTLTPLTDFGIVYRSGGVKDAVAFNSVTTANSTQSVKWSTLGVPSYVWSGDGVPLADTVTARGYVYAGYDRVAFDGGAGDWVAVTEESPMHLSNNRASWMRYTVNQCEGAVGVVTVTMSNPPSVDLVLEGQELPRGCRIGILPLAVSVFNNGVNASSGVQLNYQVAGGPVVSETLNTPLPAHADTLYTFVQPIDMTVDDDSTFAITIWATHMADDPLASNDTCRVTTVASHTPELPEFDDTIVSMYGQPATITHVSSGAVLPVWYNYEGVPVDTGYTCQTEVLYAEGEMGISYLHKKDSTVHIGELATLIGKTAYPCPYQPNKKLAKQQFIYTPYDLRSMGLQPGEVSGVAFHLDSIYKVNATTQRDSIVFNTFSIALGLTADTVFSGNAAWKTTEVVFSREDYPIYRSSSHDWVMHTLDTGFMWDGDQSLVVQVYTEIATAITTGVQTAYTAKANTTLIKSDNSNVSAEFTGNGTKGNNRPDIVIVGKVNGCEGNIKPFYVSLDGVPDVDASLTLTMGSGTGETVYNSCGNVQPVIGVRNMGRNTISNFELHYSIDGAAFDTTYVADSVVGGSTGYFTLFSEPLMPGRHTVTATVDVEGDTIPANDTLRFAFNVRFCSGDYTIGADSLMDYHSFAEAIDTLGVAGIDGTVVFHVAPGVYAEQVVLNDVQGSSTMNRIVFRGSADSASTIMTAGTNNANYIVNIDGLSNVTLDSLTIISRPPSGNNGNVVVLQNTDNVLIQNCSLTACGRINNQNSSCVVLQGNVNNLTLEGNLLDSGYYAITTANNSVGYRGIAMEGNAMHNFRMGGINLVGISAVDITRNDIRSANKSKLTGVKLENVDSVIMIQKNKIYLVTTDNTDNFGKRGLELKNVSGSNQQWAYVMNNMIGTHSNGVSGLPPAGIYLDGTSSYINIYFNTVRLYAGQTDVTQSKAFYSNTQTNHLQVLNNIFANVGKAFAYYVSSGANVTSSDYNVYFTNGEVLAFWGAANRETLTDLQVANSRDGSSLDEEPYFVANDDMHLLMTNFVGKAQYNPDVIDDIDDTIRHQIPAPTIGAHEMSRCSHNMSVVRIISPEMPININDPNDVESDSVLVKATFYNNGDATETNVRWHAYVVGHENEIFSQQRNLGSFVSGQMKTDSVMMPTILGVIDTQTIRVELIYGSSSVDCTPEDDYMTQDFFLAPAYDFEVVRLTVPSGCELQNSQVSITLKNVGFKEIPAGVEFEIGLHAQGYSGNIQLNNLANNQIQISTMPDTVRELHHSFATPLACNSSRDVLFDTPVNLYPTDTALNIKVRVNGWCRYQYDVSFDNDSSKLASSSSPQIESWYTPAPPLGHDTTLQYATWGEVTAEQENSRPIRWHRDSTATPFFTGNNYNLSRKWSTTPQYFHDSTYYLQCFSDKNCPSYFSEVHVHVMPQEANDVGIREVLAPLGSRVYMENDTVRVRIENYGTQTQNNIPVVYQLRKGNNTNPLMEIYDTCRVSIGPNQHYDFTFDTLLHFASALQAGTYQLRVWTDLPNDASRRSDTIRMVNQLRPTAPNNTSLDYVFTTLGDSYYNPNIITYDGVDFTRIAYNEIDIDLPPLSRYYVNFGDYTNPEYPVLHVQRGMVDTLMLMFVKPTAPNERTRAKIAAYIDFNRSGDFEDDPDENVLPVDELESGIMLKTPVAIPYDASLGYMKMRIIAAPYESTPNSLMQNATATAQLAGDVIDFMLFVDPEMPESDIALTMIDAPRNYLIRDTGAVSISFRMANRGTQDFVGDLPIHYRFDGDTIDSTASGVINWHGTLEAGRSTIVRLPNHNFCLGTTGLTIWHELESDTVHGNNSLEYEYHRFHTVVLRVNDNFDDSNHWYAPRGYNNYTRNYWQAGTPNKANIVGAFSEPNAWVTDSVNVITTGQRGNVSYLYSPIINIAQIRPDTLSFRLLRNLSNGSLLRVEYYDYENNWSNLVDDGGEMIEGGYWYNDADEIAFSGSSSGGVYNRYWCSSKLVSGNFNEKLQFRFVYSAPPRSSETASFGDGAAIDDFKIGRARRQADLGVIDITQPTNPKYGQTIYPEVVVKNYGTDTVRSLQVGYNCYGNSLARISTFSCVIPPEGIDTFLCTSPFIVTSDFPDTFNITAFTIWTADIYDDNDTNIKEFVLAPLDNDISAEEFIAPLERVIAGDSTCTVTMRVRNFGINPIERAYLTYTVNDEQEANEEVSFVEVLGRPLQSMEYFNYTFNKHFLASMGMMDVMGFVKCDTNDYIYNDTINKRILGISSITDLAAAAIIVDTDASTSSGNLGTAIQLIIENRGARGANNFEVGFWYDNDTSTLVQEVYSRDLPLPALTTGFYYFDSVLPRRSAPYSYVTAYVKIDDDNDVTNDTTNVFANKFVDMEAIDVIVEENAGPDCRVFMRVRNSGNVAFVNRRLRLNVVVNGNELSFSEVRRVEAYQTVMLELDRTIPKDPQRHYVGSGTIRHISGDPNEDNDMTSVVRVVNYVENVPEVAAGQLVLDQNYPNPFSGLTTIPFSLPNAANVRLFVMDAMGHIVYTQEGRYPSGSNAITIDMERYSTGVYYYGIEVDGVRQMRKMIVR